MAIEDPAWPRADTWLARGDPEPEIQVVGVPSSSASLSPSQAGETPSALRERLSRFSTFHGEWIVDLGPLAVVDRGDLPVAELDMWEMPAEVESLAGALPRVPLTLFLGGDNAITAPLVRATAGGDLGSVGVLTFDAHHDVRSLDQGPTNGTPIRGLIEDGLPGDHVAQVGIHSFANSLPYRRWCDTQGIAVSTMTDVDTWGVEDVVSLALDHLASRAELIYVDVDIDVLDRTSAPGCPGARPGGMTVRQLALAARIAARHPRVVAMDFVEVDPARDPDGLTLDALATVFLAACAGYAERRRTDPQEASP